MTILERYKKIHQSELRQFHYSMFEYTNLPETVDPLYLEKFLQHNEPFHFVAWWKLDRDSSPGFPAGSLIVSDASFGNKLNPYGEGTQVICVTKNGREKTFASRYDDDVVCGFNNTIKMPCFDIDVDSDTLSETDLSILYLIHYTRLYPIFRAADEKTRDKIITAFKNMELGKPLTIIDQPLLEDLEISAPSIKMDTITNPELSRVIQYTSKLREDLKRWHFTKYGQTINSSSKLAQETVDEVNGAVSASLILPLDMLNARRKMIEEVNRKFGTDISVDFSGAWRAEITRYEEISGEGEIDGTENESVKEGEINEDRENEDNGNIDGSDDNESV